MIQIPFSLFIEFVLSPSHERFAVVKKSRTRGAYGPQKDFYLLLKNEMRRSVLRNERVNIERVLGRTDHTAKHDNYPAIAENFERWRCQKKRDFFVPPEAIWRSKSVTIKVQPDVAFECQGQRYAGFMHYRKDLEIKKSAADFLLHVPAEAFDAKGILGYRYCLIDVRTPKAWNLGNLRPATSKQLQLEAESFASMYRELDADEAA